jgi:hypothetical protein
MDYLKSKEFSEMFDYIDENVNFVFWANSQGYPAMIEISIIVIPPDTATQLADKQGELTFKAVFKDINKPLNINVPNESIPIEQAMKEYENNILGQLGEASVRGETAKLKANLSGFRAVAELVYDQTTGGGYGQKTFSLGPCKKMASTLFGDETAYSYISKATNEEPSKATCISTYLSGKVNSYAVSVPLPDSPDYSWCVDSSGNSRQIKGSVKKESCI